MYELSKKFTSGWLKGIVLIQVMPFSMEVDKEDFDSDANCHYKIIKCRKIA